MDVLNVENAGAFFCLAQIFHKIRSQLIFLVSYSKNQQKEVGTLRIGFLFVNKQPLPLEVFPL